MALGRLRCAGGALYLDPTAGAWAEGLGEVYVGCRLHAETYSPFERDFIDRRKVTGF